MRILWITNIMLPPIARRLCIEPTPVGGWMYSSLQELKKLSTHKFAVATVYEGNEIITHRVDDAIYYLLPLRGRKMEQYNPQLEAEWIRVRDEFQPDVVHIHGSEYPHGLAYVNACGNENVVLSIQGLLSVYARYLWAGIKQSDMPKSLLRTLLRRGTYKSIQNEWNKRGEREREYLRRVNNFMGRTEWDKSHIWAINPAARYFYASETLRGEFYKHKWEYAKCRPHSIFLSQAGYSIKGLHKLLEAMSLVVRQFPDTVVRIAGQNILAEKWPRKSLYAQYINRLIDKYSLRGNIEFIGPKSEQEMVREYLSANLFICPSSIENSPNSVGEAQLLGMPIIASNVGGTAELLEQNPDQLYRFEETEMLARKICEIFAAGVSYVVPRQSLDRYNPQKNATQTLKIYERILTNCHDSKSL